MFMSDYRKICEYISPKTLPTDDDSLRSKCNPFQAARKLYLCEKNNLSPTLTTTAETEMFLKNLDNPCFDVFGKLKFRY